MASRNHIGFIPDQIRVLVSTANLGNTPPDPASLSSWIPRDGLCSAVIQPSPKYPVVMDVEHEDDEWHVGSPLPLEMSLDDQDDSSSTRSDDSEPTPQQVPPAKASSEREGLTAEKRKEMAHSLAVWAKQLRAKVTAKGFEDKNNRSDVFKSDQLVVDESDQFEIIVIGMQEATFDLDLSSTPSTLAQYHLTPGDRAESFGVGSAVVQPLQKGAKVVGRGVGKGVQKIARFTQDRDYTKKLSSRHLPLPSRDWGGGTALLHTMLDAQLPSYERVVSYQRGQMRLEVYCNSNAVDVEVLRVTAHNTGRAGLANKGGIVAELQVNGATRLSFMTAHLAAHEGHSNYRTRCSSLGEILGGTKESRWLDVSQTSHFTFVLGDLNFRTFLDSTLPKDAHRRAISGMVDRKNWSGLNKVDELHMALRQNHCLVGYKTPMCNFPPTFKTVRKGGFEWQEKRRPSYCDRILWKVARDLDNSISPLVYEPIGEFSTSDHKPVRAAFSIDLNSVVRVRPRGKATNRIGKSLRFGDNHGRQEEHETERVELFLSNISVMINQKEGLPPNPYVSLLSYPEEALHLKSPKWRARLRTVDRGQRRTNGWPSTSRMFATFAPSWVDEEEIKCRINLHHPDGSSIDFAGAMLHIAVFDFNPGMEDSLIGSIGLNLTSILSKCREQATGILQSQNGLSSLTPKSRFRSAGKSIVAMLRAKRQNEEHDVLPTLAPARQPASSSEEPTDPITVVVIDEVLTKNGRETGRLKCTLEAWCINAATARILVSKPMQAAVPRASLLRHFAGRKRSAHAVRRSGVRHKEIAVMIVFSCLLPWLRSD